MGTEIEKRASTTLAQYGSFDLEDMLDAESQIPSKGGNYLKLGQGKNVLRFLPPLQGKKPTKLYHKHYFQLGEERRQVICPRLQFNKPCAICQKGADLRSTGNKADAQAATAFDPSSQVYVNIVDMNDPERGVQLWPISQGLWKDIRKAIDMAEVGKTFAHPTEGCNVVVDRTGEKMATRYKVQVARNNSELPNASDLIKTQYDLESVEAFPEEEDIDEAAYEGVFEAKKPFSKKGSGRDQGRGSSRGSSRSGRGGDSEDAEFSEPSGDDLNY